MDYGKYSDILKVLGHPIRLRMVDGLMRNECNVNKIVRVLDIPQSTVSQHLALLKSKGIVEARKDGVRTCYRVIEPRVREIVEILKK